MLGELGGLLDACRTFQGDQVDQGKLFGGDRAIDQLLVSSGLLASHLSDALTLRYFSHVNEIPLATGTF